MSEEVFGDIAEKFDLDGDSMDYADGPLSGWLRRKEDGLWFAFDCQPTIADKLWHWTLVPAEQKCPDVAGYLREARTRRTGSWVSITEDRRAAVQSGCRLVQLESSETAPVLLSAYAR